MLAMTNGVLRNGPAQATSTLTSRHRSAHPTNAVTLNGVNNVFDVPLQMQLWTLAPSLMAAGRW